jgi:hypothetical protein
VDFCIGTCAKIDQIDLVKQAEDVGACHFGVDAGSANYLRGLDPAHRPLIIKGLVDCWCLYGIPEQLREKTQVMLDSGCDMVSVFVSNPFTTGRDIGHSILAHA